MIIWSWHHIICKFVSFFDQICRYLSIKTSETVLMGLFQCLQSINVYIDFIWSLLCVCVFFILDNMRTDSEILSAYDLLTKVK